MLAATSITYLLTFYWSNAAILVGWIFTTFLVRYVGGYITSKVNQGVNLVEWALDLVKQVKDQALVFAGLKSQEESTQDVTGKKKAVEEPLTPRGDPLLGVEASYGRPIGKPPAKKEE